MAMVDCRNLIEFCRAFERQHYHNNNFNNSNRRNNNNNNSCRLNPLPWKLLCNRSCPPLAALDLILLLIALASLAFLIIVPCFRFLFFEALPRIRVFITDLIIEAPVECFLGLVLGLLVFTSSLILWDIIDSRLRRCQNPNCKGLRRAVVYDIQLESEECVKYSPPPLPFSSSDAATAADDNHLSINDLNELELGQDGKELEAHLKKLAPPNGRTVLIFRSPCGCPAGKLEVWGHKKVRRIKK